MEIFSFGQEARGFIAIGQFATGVIAIGQVATGVIAVGQMARGVIAVGQLAVGGFTLGMGSFGAARAWGMISVGGVARGLLPLSLLPRPQAPVPLPETVSAQSVLDGTTAAGWIRARVVPHGDGVRVLEGGHLVPVHFASAALMQKMQNVKSMATAAKMDLLLYVTRDQNVDDGADGYRAPPEVQNVLTCTEFKSTAGPSSHITAGSWIARAVGLATVTAAIALAVTYDVFWTVPA